MGKTIEIKYKTYLCIESCVYSPVNDNFPVVSATSHRTHN